ncbi:MAG TPA: lipopolysaccharide heptosyltransferase II [Xanthobacteraceae bacterium]|jgi:heptosyltransferase-2
MTLDSQNKLDGAADERPTLLVPYIWIGDFVRCHTVVRLLRARFPRSPIDVLTTVMVAPLLDYMPGVRNGIVWDLPRKRLAFAQHRALAARLQLEGYARAFVMPRTWKSALAPYLAGIPQRTGFAGEARFGLLNDLRWGERALPRMIERCVALALPKGAPLPKDYLLPQLEVPDAAVAAWRQRLGLAAAGRIAAFAPGAVGPSKRWPASYYAEAARRLVDAGFSVWVLGGPGETALAAEIAAGSDRVHDLTGPDLRNAILAMAAADVAVSNDSGLLHVAAALGTPSIGIFGPTSPWHWAPLNPLAAVIETQTQVDCRPCHKPTCRYGHHRCMREIPAERVAAAALAALAPGATPA